MTESAPEPPNPASYPLPVVTRDVMTSFLADNSEKGKVEIIREAESQLTINNPQLDKMVLAHMVAEGFASEDMSDTANLVLLGVIRRAVVITHEIIRRQSNLNSFNAQYHLGDSD